MTRQFKTTEEVREHVAQFDHCPKEVTSALFMYLDNVEHMLETDDNFLPGRLVTWNQAVGLFIDLIVATHYDLQPI